MDTSNTSCSGSHKCGRPTSSQKAGVEVWRLLLWLQPLHILVPSHHFWETVGWFKFQNHIRINIRITSESISESISESEFTKHGLDVLCSLHLCLPANVLHQVLHYKELTFTFYNYLGSAKDSMQGHMQGQYILACTVIAPFNFGCS